MPELTQNSESYFLRTDPPGQTCSAVRFYALRTRLARSGSLHHRRVWVNCRSMKFYSAMIVWFLMAAIITTGIVLAVFGKPLLLFIGLFGFIFAVGKIGCATH